MALLQFLDDFHFRSSSSSAASFLPSALTTSALTTSCTASTHDEHDVSHLSSFLVSAAEVPAGTRKFAAQNRRGRSVALVVPSANSATLDDNSPPRRSPRPRKTPAKTAFFHYRYKPPPPLIGPVPRPPRYVEPPPPPTHQQKIVTEAVNATAHASVAAGAVQKALSFHLLPSSPPPDLAAFMPHQPPSVTQEGPRPWSLRQEIDPMDRLSFFLATASKKERLRAGFPAHDLTRGDHAKAPAAAHLTRRHGELEQSPTSIKGGKDGGNRVKDPKVKESSFFYGVTISMSSRVWQGNSSTGCTTNVTSCEENRCKISGKRGSCKRGGVAFARRKHS